jgi:hypothetical protein
MNWTTAQWLMLGLSVGNATGMILNVKGKPAGWGFVAAAQATFGTYLIVTKQWTGIAQFVCLGIALWGLWTWLTKGVHHSGSDEQPTQQVPTTSAITELAEPKGREYGT